MHTKQIHDRKLIHVDSTAKAGNCVIVQVDGLVLREGNGTKWSLDCMPVTHTKINRGGFPHLRLSLAWRKIHCPFNIYSLPLSLRLKVDYTALSQYNLQDGTSNKQRNRIWIAEF